MFGLTVALLQVNETPEVVAFAFLGGAVVEARGFASAMRVTHQLGINPGGEVKGALLDRAAIDTLPVQMRNRLLTKAEIESWSGRCERW